MGQGPSGLRQPQQRCRAEHRQLCSDKGGAQLRRRIQLLEELCSHQEPGRRAEVLQQLAGGHADGETLDIANVLGSRPLEFSPGELIAAGSYGRVYAGTYAGQPAALKLLLLDEETAHAILNEVRLCLKLSHKNLVQLLDCAVVATSKQTGSAGFMCPASPGFNPVGQHQVLPVFGPSSSPVTPSAAPTYNYLPVVSGQVPFDSTTSALSAHLVSSSMAANSSSITADHRHTGSPAVQDLAPLDSDRRSAICPTLSHACFEVWIAMELCDGGTLAEQLQRGFHCHPGSEQVDMEQLLQVGLDIAHALSYMHGESVCHGDLKTENVLLKTLSPASESMQGLGSARSKSSCSCCHEECSWLTFLCNNSPGTSCSASRYCRSCSGESCWSCYSHGVGCMDPGGNSSPDSCSTSSSNLSGANTERRSRSGFKGSHLLSGLCCMGSPSSCTTEDDLWAQQDERMASVGCLGCGCGVMTLEPSERGGYNTQALSAQQQQLLCAEQEPLCAAAAQHEPAAQLGSSSVLAPSSHADAAAAAAHLLDAAAPPTSSAQMYSGLHPASQGLTPTIVEGVVQQLQVPLSFGGGLYDEWAPQHAALPLEDVPEEEHVAPLSLYTEARQRRRSRCLPPGVVLPTALAAAAAAAAAAMNGSDAHHPLPSSSEGSSSGSSDEEGQGRKLMGSRPGVPQQQSLQGPGSCEDSSPPLPAAAPAAGSLLEAAAAAAAAASSSADPLPARPSWQDAAGLPGVSSHLDVYSMMLPPVPRRARRHSYCCGSTPSYGGPVFSFGRPGMPRAPLNPAGSISASEAAAAIAAAAEAVRHDSARAVGSTERGRSRSRRMSWDDRMLSHQSPTRSGLSGLLSGLPGLSRGADVGGVQPSAGLWQQQQQLDAANQPGRARRTRRHSWAGYLQPDMASAAAGVLAPFGNLHPQELQQQQQQQLSRLLPIRSESIRSGSVLAAATPDSAGVGAMPSSRRGGGRARRHSWAGYGREQGLGKLSGMRALSSSFFAGGGDSAGHSPMHNSPQRHSFSLPPFPGCCGDSLFRPLLEAGSDAECSRHALLEGGPSSTLLADSMASHGLGQLNPELEAEAAGMGCFGRWCSSGTSSSFASSCGSAVRDRCRRCSWCCGAGSEADLWADLHLQESSASQLQLLSPAAPLSEPLMPQQARKGRRDRRCSWDDTRYCNKLTSGWTRKANSMDAQGSSCNSRPLSSPVSGLSQLFRSSSSGDPTLGQFAAAAPAPVTGVSQSAGLPLLPPLSGAFSAVSSSSLQQEQPDSQLMQLISPVLSCNASPAAPSICATPVAPIMGVNPMSPVAAAAAADKPSAGVNQCFSGPHACVGPAPLASAKISRVRVSLNQPPLPLLLPPPGPTGQQQQEDAHKPWTSADDGDLQSSRDVAAAHGLWQSAAPQHVLAAARTATHSLAGPSNLAASAAVARQVPEPVSVCLPGVLPAPPAAAGLSVPRVSTQGSVVDSAAADAHDAEQDLFTGSFTLHPSGHAVGAAQDTGAATAPCRGRRWSTGVAAHQLLMRKELLDAHGSDVLLDLGLSDLELQGAGAGADACTSARGSSSLQASTASQQPLWQATCSVPVVDTDLPVEAARSGVPRIGSYSSSASGDQRQMSCTSSVTNNAINVLGIPRKRSSVVSQRRMSYDTATGAYQLAAQLDDAHISSMAVYPVATGQQLQQQQHMLAAADEQPPATQQRPQPAAELADVSQLLFSRVARAATPGAVEAGASAAAGAPTQQQLAAVAPVSTVKLAEQLQEEQMQQHCQAQMQRLLEALAKKGYGGLEDASVHTGSSAANAQRAQQAGPAEAATAALQQQQGPQRRFCAKVCDFGFSKCLRAGQSHCSTASAGTITHQAPEVLRHGHLSPAADVYAFGIILWELLTRDRPFRGLLEGDLVVGVCDQGLRPTFPAGCPQSYVALAQQCWSEDMSQRPTAAQLVKRLNELLYEERRSRLHYAAASNAALPGSKDATCRRRRHSMPIAVGHGKQRRRSRRMSLFLLPFTRQPVVPEDALLEQQVGDWGSRSGQHACLAHSTAAAAAAAAAAVSSSGSRVSMEQQQQAAAASGSSPLRPCSDRLSLSSGLNSIGNSGCLISTSGSGNAVAHAGGLLASSSTLVRLKGASAAAPAGASAPGHTGRAAPDGTEWFESF